MNHFGGRDDVLTVICEELLERAHEVERESLDARGHSSRVMTIWLEHVASHRQH